MLDAAFCDEQAGLRLAQKHKDALLSKAKDENTRRERASVKVQAAMRGKLVRDDMEVRTQGRRRCGSLAMLDVRWRADRGARVGWCSCAARRYGSRGCA